MKRKTLFASSLLFLILCASLLISGHPILLSSIVPGGGMPLGNLITWIGMATLPISIFLGSPRLSQSVGKTDRFISILLKGLIGLAISWGVVSYFLAGNWAFTFSQKGAFQGSQKAYAYFWNYSYFLVAAPLLLLLVLGIRKLIYFAKNGNSS